MKRDESLSELFPEEISGGRSGSDYRAYPVLSHEEFLRLFAAWKAGDREAYDLLVLHNMGLARTAARKFLNSGLGFWDLAHEGVFGVMQALERFKPEMGYRFSTYATPWVERYVIAHVLNHGSTIRIPVYMHNNMRKVLKATGELLEEGVEATEAAIAKRLSMTVRQLKKIMNVLDDRGAPSSLDAPLSKTDDQGSTLGDTLVETTFASPEAVCLARQELEKTRKAVDEFLSWCLSTFGFRETRIICLRYGITDNREPRTLSEIAREYGQCRQSADQKVKKVWRRKKTGVIQSEDEFRKMLEAALDFEEICGEGAAFDEEFFNRIVERERRNVVQEELLIAARLEFLCATVNAATLHEYEKTHFLAHYKIGNIPGMNRQQLAAFCRLHRIARTHLPALLDRVWKYLGYYSKYFSEEKLIKWLKEKHNIPERKRMLGYETEKK